MKKTQPKMKICEPQPEEPRPVLVDVTILSDYSKGEYEMRSPGRPGDPDHVPIENGREIVFDNKQDGEFRPGFLVRFRLTHRGDGGKYRFASNLDDALWVKIADSRDDCVRVKGNPGGIFDPVDLQANGRTLVVENRNDCKQLFAFALNFEPIDPNGKKLSYDPIGDNRNGTAE